VAGRLRFTPRSREFKRGPSSSCTNKAKFQFNLPMRSCVCERCSVLNFNFAFTSRKMFTNRTIFQSITECAPNIRRVVTFDCTHTRDGGDDTHTAHGPHSVWMKKKKPVSASGLLAMRSVKSHVEAVELLSQCHCSSQPKAKPLEDF
jgi:hypothetical protein